MKYPKYLIALFVVIMSVTADAANPPTNANLTPAQKAQAKLAESKLTPAQKLAQAQKLTAQKKAMAGTADKQKSSKTPTDTKKPVTPPMTEKQKSTQDHEKLMQDFLTAAKKLPDYKSEKDPKSHEKEVEKVFEAYKKMQKEVKNISLTKSDNDKIRKAANNLFDYKHIEHMAWVGYKIIPDSKTPGQKSSTTPTTTPTKK